LKAGKYVVQVDEAGSEVQFMKGSEVVAKHRCKYVDLKEKNRHNQARFMEGEGKKQLLQELRFGGDSRSIVLD
jgi:hypothetical protein